MTNDPQPPPHANKREFAQAVQSTAAKTGFSARLIEKDYHCSLLLRGLDQLFKQGLVFKGGTCLSKVHTQFFRLSEDLDFGISIAGNAIPRVRRDAARLFKDYVEKIPLQQRHLSIDQQVAGHNCSCQYTVSFAYSSVLTENTERLKLELSLREEILMKPNTCLARTILISPETDQPAIDPFEVTALNLDEAYAEKVRAALTRRKPAIRDVFDVGMAITSNLIDHRAERFLELVKRKLKVVENQEPVALSPQRLDVLRRQQETQLKPVLRAADYAAFDFEATVQVLGQIADRVCASDGI